ncbi:MAG: cytochrome c-type biogenesis protein [Pseudomonadota bacterium]
MKVAILAAVLAVMQSGTTLSDPAEERRAQMLMREIRCVACENEPVSQSASDIAGDMREQIREMVAEGQTNSEIRAWFVDRYGEFVLFRPKADNPWGWMLWALPFAVLGVAGAGIVMMRNSRDLSERTVDAVPPDHEDGNTN